VERMYVFLPSVLIIACIAGVAFLCAKLFIKRFGDNFKSVEWHEKNQWRVAWTVSTPLINVWAPAVEEIIFRAPLIIAFSAISSFAWYGIFASSGLFALIHWFGKKIWMPEILSAREKDNQASDDVVAEVNRLHTEKGKTIIIRKVFHVVFAFPLAILAGYYGIKYQSVWVAFSIHLVWNLFMPIVSMLFTLLVMFVVLGASSLWDRVRWKRRGLW